MLLCPLLDFSHVCRKRRHWGTTYSHLLCVCCPEDSIWPLGNALCGTQKLLFLKSGRHHVCQYSTVPQSQARSFQFENRSPDPVTSSLSTDIPFFKCQQDSKLLHETNHQHWPFFIQYHTFFYFSPILHVPTGRQTSHVHTGINMSSVLQTPVAYLTVILTAWPGTAND